MKNSLLAVMALCGATSSTLPLWASEKYPDPTLAFVDPDLEQSENGGGVYYIYHVATQKFMNDGNWKNNWGSELVVAEDGLAVTLTWGQDYELSRHDPSASDYNAAYGWRMSMMEGHSDKNFHELYLLDGSCICVDHNAQGHILWKIMKQDNGTYRIKIADEDPIYGAKSDYANSFIGVNENDHGVNPLIIPGSQGYEKAEFDWRFVESDVYEVYMAKKKLQVALDEAAADGYAQVAQYEALYNSTTATAEEIAAAVPELKQEVVNWKSSAATPSQPVDFTTMIENSSFDDGNNGWDVVGSIGHQAGTTYETADNRYKMDHFSEKWVSSGNNGNLSNNPMDISQTLENMPTGKYRLTANTLGYWQGDWQNTVPNGVYLFAENEGIEYRAEAHTLEFGGIRGTEGVVAEAPSPRNVELEFFTLGGTIKVGFKTVNTNCNWVGVDNFKLEYLGMAEGGMAEELQKVITDAEKLKEEYATATYSKAGEAKFDELLKTAKEAVANPDMDDKALGVMLTSLQAGMDTLKMDVNAYKTLNEKINTLNEEWENSVYVDLDMPDYDQFLTDLETAYSGRSFDPAEIDSIQPRADRLWKDGVRQGLKDGLTDNVTGLLSNPNFTGNNNGWTYKFVSGDNKFNHGNDMAEVYQTVCDVYQELEDMPSGTYEVTLQGFYRPSWNGTCAEAWGIEGDTTNDILAYAYGNDTQEKLRHVFECVQDTNTVNNCEQLTTGGSELEGKWVPNGMASAAAIMTANSDNYRVSFKCYVEDDGKLRLGITIPKAGLAGYWALFDNFQVTYHEGDMSGAEGTLNALIEKATDLVNQEGLTTQEAKDGLHTAIEAANEAMGKELTLETYTKNKTALNEAIEVGQAALDAAAAFETLVTEQVNNFDTGVYDDYSGAEYDAFQDLLLDKMQPVLESLESVEQIEGYTVEINKAYAKMVASVIETSTATLDTPGEMTSLIQSPSFSTKAENGVDEVGTIKGWSTNGNQNASGALNYEFWQVEGADIHQTLYALPKGYYRLTYNGFYRAGGFIAAGVAHRDSIDARNGEVYLESGEGKWTEKLASIFDNINEYKYSSGDVVLPDSLFPASTKLYNCMVNDVTGADLAFKDGKYEGTFSFYVSEAGQPTLLGVRKTAHLGDDWLCFDNFKLLYYGDGDTNKPDDFVSSVEEAVADGKATVVSSAWYTINGVRVAEPKQRGIYIRQDKMSDGTTQSVKVMVR